MSLSLWTADSAMAKGTPAVAIRILPPPPSVFTPVLEMANSYNKRKETQVLCSTAIYEDKSSIYKVVRV